MELISRDDAKRIIDNIDTFCAGWRDYAKEKIDNAPTIDPVKWIPVTERMPEKAGSYLVTLQGNENAISLGGDNPFVWVELFDGSEWHNSSWYDVLAWREKPEPWKEKSDE